MSKNINGLFECLRAERAASFLRLTSCTPGTREYTWAHLNKEVKLLKPRKGQETASLAVRVTVYAYIIFCADFLASHWTKQKERSTNLMEWHQGC